MSTLKSTEDATSTGAAVVGGVACGMFPDFGVVDRLLAVDEVVRPDAARGGLYRRRQALAVKAYHGLEGVFSEMKGTVC